MADHRFIPDVTDQGAPRAAQGGFPYPGHGPLGDAAIEARKHRSEQFRSVWQHYHSRYQRT